MLRLTADWIIPISSAPIERGALLVGRDGRVEAIGQDAAVPHPPGVREERFAGAALLPGLVNAHTHLELTGLDAAAPPNDFPGWIRSIREQKERRTPEEYRAAVREGVRASWAAGVTTVADTGDSGAVIEALAELGGSGVAYQEVFGPHPDQLVQSLRHLEEALDRQERLTSARVRGGVSPHAPYTVSGPLYRAVATLAAERDLPIAVHLAESLAESELIAQGTGRFADAWRARGIPLPDDVRHLDKPLAVRTPVRWLEAFGVLGPDTLCIHVVQADAADLAVLARNEVGIAHCPLSNAAHRHGEAPLAAMLAAGLRVGVGTDSAASVGRLDLLAEARAARALAGLDAAHALRLATLDAARAIGVSDVGVLAEGAWGDVAVLDLGGKVPGAPADSRVRRSAEVLEAVLAASPEAVLATYLGGRQVYRRT